MKTYLHLLLTVLLLQLILSRTVTAKVIYVHKVDASEVIELNKLSDALGLSGLTGWPVSGNEQEKLEVDGVEFLVTDTLKRASGQDEIRVLVNKVRSVRLKEKGLAGTLPNLSFGELINLELGGNSISGKLPVLNLPKCERLILYGNQFTGPIPAFNMPEIVSISLHDNQLTGTIPAYNYPKLTDLILGNNQLVGPLPDMLLPSLQTFTASSNKLTGPVPVWSLPALFLLDLSGNEISGTLPLLNLPKAREIRLSNNRLSGSVPDWNMAELVYLYLENNLLDGNIGKLTMPKLEVLDLTKNQLTGDFDNSGLPALAILKLGNNNLSGLPDLKKSSPKLVVVETANNRLTFEDFELNLGLPFSIASGQQRVELYEGTDGNRKILYVKTGGSKNKYQWMKRKDGNITTVTGAVNDTIWPLTESGAPYMCIITSELVAGLSIYSTVRELSSCIETFSADGRTGCASSAVTLTTGSQDLLISAEIKDELIIYPNPAGDKVTLRFSIGTGGYCRIMITDITGRLIAVPVAGNFPEGVHEIQRDFGPLPAGIFLVSLHSPAGITTTRAILGR